MFALRKVSANVAKLSQTSVRNYGQHSMVTPPRVRIPFGEKLLHFAFIYCVIWSVPVYIATHMKYYTKKVPRD